MAEPQTRDGGCSCGAIRFRMTGEPMFVHCCHCTVCQRQTGSAFAVNAIIESSRVALLQGTPEMVMMDSPSGAGQEIARCPECKIAVWSHYMRRGRAIAFVRLGALDDATGITPSIHVYASSKQPWVQLPDDVPVMSAFYDFGAAWPTASQERMKAALRT